MLDQVARAALAAAMVSVSSAFVGPGVVYRGLSFMVSGVAHAALAGAALAMLASTLTPLSLDPAVGAVAAGIAVAALVSWAGGGEGRAEEMETAVGVTFAGAMSLAVLTFYVIPSERIPEVWGYLLGDILLLSPLDLIVLSLTTAACAVGSAAFYREFLYVTFDPEGAEAHGMRPRVYQWVHLSLTALAVAGMTKAVGAIMVYALVVAPAAAAARLSRGVKGTILLTFALAALASAAGMLVGFWADVSPSAAAGLAASLMYVASVRAAGGRG